MMMKRGGGALTEQSTRPLCPWLPLGTGFGVPPRQRVATRGLRRQRRRPRWVGMVRKRSCAGRLSVRSARRRLRRGTTLAGGVGLPN